MPMRRVHLLRPPWHRVAPAVWPLTLATAPRALAAEADILAVRGAACRGGRDGAVDVQRVRALAASVKGRRAPLPAARGQNA